MKKSEFIEKIADGLFMEGKELELETELDELEEWDSIGRLGIIALINDLFNKKIEAKALKDCKRVKDIMKLVQEFLEE